MLSDHARSHRIVLQANRLYGTGPAHFTPADMSHFFKFSSAGKEFEQLTSVTFSVSVDAVTLHRLKRTDSGSNAV